MDLSSPRATLSSFFSLGNRIGQLISGPYWENPSPELAERLTEKQLRVQRFFDLSQVPPAARADVAYDASVYLYEVLSRIDLPPLQEIPGPEEVSGLAPVVATATASEESNGKSPVGPAPAPEPDSGGDSGLATSSSWTVPHTEITLVRLAEGPHSGEFVFSAETVERAADFYQRVRELPYQREVAIPNYAEMRPYLAMRGWLVSPRFIDSLPDWLKRSVFQQALWKWIALLGVSGIFFGLLLIIQRATRRFRNSSVLPARLSRFLAPLLLLLTLRPLSDFLHRQLTLIDRVGSGYSLLAEVLTYLALAWLAWTVPPALMDIYINRNRGLHKESLDAHLLRFIARTLGIAGVVAVAFMLTSRLGAPLYSLLAGFGIGGIAAALALRGSFENFIGSLNLFGDKPVRVGDFCRYGEDPSSDFQRMGTVESIGMRSTRLRGIDNSLTTIPNADFSQMHIVNYSTRRSILLRTMLSLRFETTEDQLRYVLVSIREMLVGHPRVLDEEPSVRFAGFGAASLEVELRVDLLTADLPEYRAIREDVLFRVFRIVRKSGTDFAFPSQTVYFTRDGGIDREAQQRAEHHLREWAAEQQMPFPNFTAEQRAALRNTVYYPPEGSPDAET